MWTEITSTVNTIRQRVPEPYSSTILNFNLELTNGDSCYPSGNTIICARRLANPQTLVHEYGHARFQTGFGYPEGWHWTFKEITGYDYVGKGNNMIAEGYAEVVSRALLGNHILNSDAANFVKNELGLTIAGAPETFSILSLLFLASTILILLYKPKKISRRSI